MTTVEGTFRLVVPFSKNKSSRWQHRLVHIVIASGLLLQYKCSCISRTFLLIEVRYSWRSLFLTFFCLFVETSTGFMRVFLSLDNCHLKPYIHLYFRGSLGKALLSILRVNIQWRQIQSIPEQPTFGADLLQGKRVLKQCLHTET
jgi:hypothetical protein